MDNYKKINKNSYAGSKNIWTKVSKNSWMDNNGKQVTKIGNSYWED